MESTLLAGLIALVAAGWFAIGSVAQQGAAAQVPGGQSGVTLLATLARRPQWWVGFLGDSGGYVLQAVALGLGPLLVVQPLLVASLVFTLPVAAWWTARRVSTSDLGWAVALSVALAAFLVVGDPTAGVDHASGRAWAAVASVLGMVVGLCAFGATVTRGAAKAALLAVSTGVCFGLAAALTKAFVDALAEGLLEPLAHAETYALVGVGALGFYFQQAAFQAGSLSASLPTMTVAEPVVAVGVGVAILQESLRGDGLELVLLGLSGAVMVLATVALSRSSARSSARARAT